MQFFLDLGIAAIMDSPELVFDLIESGCDVNADRACVSFDHLAYFEYYFNFMISSYFGDYNFTSHDLYGDYNFSSYDQYGDYNFTYYDRYGDYNSTPHDQYEVYNFTSNDQYGDYNFAYYKDFNYTSNDYYSDCEMDPLLHIAVGMKSTEFLSALKKVHGYQVFNLSHDLGNGRSQELTGTEKMSTAIQLLCLHTNSSVMKHSNFCLRGKFSKY